MDIGSGGQCGSLGPKLSASGFTLPLLQCLSFQICKMELILLVRTELVNECKELAQCLIQSGYFHSWYSLPLASARPPVGDMSPSDSLVVMVEVSDDKVFLSHREKETETQQHFCRHLNIGQTSPLPEASTPKCLESSVESDNICQVVVKIQIGQVSFSRSHSLMRTAYVIPYLLTPGPLCSSQNCKKGGFQSSKLATILWK